MLCLQSWKTYGDDIHPTMKPTQRYVMSFRTDRLWIGNGQISWRLCIDLEREVIPADILVLAVAEPAGEPSSGICYIETKSLDGETNLKLWLLR